jgi:tetratricopeptide (TPR) repeat protein
MSRSITKATLDFNGLLCYYDMKDVFLPGGTRGLVMPRLTIDEIRKRFELSGEFNELFDAFEQAIEQRIEDIELYRQLFWNHTLTPDELCLFGEKLAAEFPLLAYDTYMWLANIFEVTYSMYDNYELAFEYYQKAALARPSEPDPYLDAADCYEPDLNIPPISKLIDFLKKGAAHVTVPKPLYQKLAYLYELIGNDEMQMYCKMRAEDGSTPPAQPPAQPPDQDDPPPAQ